MPQDMQALDVGAFLDAEFAQAQQPAVQTAPQAQPLQGGVPAGGSAYSQIMGQVREDLYREDPLDFFDAFTDTDWRKKLPFFGSAFEVAEMKELYDASKRMEVGQGTRDDEALLMAFAAAGQQERTFGNLVGEIVTSLPGFAIEFLVSGGAANLAKGGAKKLLGKGLRESIESVSAKLGKKSLTTLGAKKMAAGGLAATAGVMTAKETLQAAGLGLGRAAVQTAAMNAIGEAAGGSRVRAGAIRRALPEMSLTEDQAGQLALVFNSTVGDFVEELPAAALSELIEMVSERMGGQLVEGAQSLTAGIRGSKPFAPAQAMMVEVADWWARKNPGKMGEFVSTVAKKTGWNGPLGEFLEERAAGAMRGGTGVEEGGILANAFPSLEQMGAELVAFSVPGAAMRGGRAVLDQGQGDAAPQAVDTSTPEGKLVEQAREGRPQMQAPEEQTAPEDVEAVAQEGVVALQEELDRNATEERPAERVEIVQVAEEDFEAARTVEEAAAERGIDIRWYSTESGNPADLAGMQASEGVVLVDVALLQEEGAVERFVVHEAFHDIGAKDFELMNQTIQELAKFDAPGLQASMRDVQAARDGGIPADLLLEEGGARRAEELEGLLSYLGTPKGKEWLSTLEAQEDKTALQRVIDLVKSLLQRLGFDAKTSEQVKLQELSDALGQDVPAGDLASAEVIRAALDTAAIPKIKQAFDGRPTRILPPSQRPTVGAPPATVAPSEPAAQEQEEAPQVERSTVTAPPEKTPETAALMERGQPGTTSKPVTEPEARATESPLTPAQEKRARQKRKKLAKRAKDLRAAGLDEAAQKVEAKITKSPAAQAEPRQEPETRAERAARLFDEGEERANRFAPRPGAGIRKKRDRREFAGFDLGDESPADAAIRVVQDEFVRVERFEKGVEKAGGTVKKSVYRAIELLSGKTQALANKLNVKFVDPAIRLLNDARISAEEADNYLYARTAGERNDYIAKKRLGEWTREEAVKVVSRAQAAIRRNTGKLLTRTRELSSAVQERKKGRLSEEIANIERDTLEQRDRIDRPRDFVGRPPANLPFQDVNKDPGSGLSTKDARDIIAKVNIDGRAPAFKKFAQLVHAMNRDTARLQVELGLVSQAQADSWAKTFKYYVPLRTAIEGVHMGGGRGFSVGGAEVKGAKGRRSAAHSPFTFSVEQAEKAIVRGLKNRVGGRFLALIEANPELMGTFSVRREGPTEPDADGNFIPQEPLPQKNEFSVKVKGEQVYIQIKDKMLYRALARLGGQDMSAPVRVASKLMRFLSAINTSLDPDFILGNFPRDAGTALINLGGSKGAEFAKTVMRYTFLGSKGEGRPGGAVWRMDRGKVDPKGVWDGYLERMSSAGGLAAWYHAPDFVGRARDLQVQINRDKEAPLEQVKDVMKGALAFVDDMNSAVENNVRLAAFRAAVDSGMTDEAAASLAKNLTINFNRKGEAGTGINSLYLFYNASVQGSATMFRYMKYPAVRRIMMGIAASAFLLDMANRAIGDEDEDGVSFYDKIPEWIKARNMIFMLPGTGGDYLKLPLPYGYNVPHVLGQQASSVSAGVISLSDAFLNTLSTAWESFYPLGSEATLAQTLMPTLVDPIIQIAENKNFTGAPIAPTQGFGLRGPDSQQYWNSVSPVPRVLAEWLNEISGGDRVEPGAVDVSPETLEHVYEFFSGGVGRQINRAAKAMSSIADGEAPRVRDVMFLRRIMGEQDERFDRVRYIEQRDEVQRAAAQLKEYSGDPSRLRKIREEKANLLKLRSVSKKTESMLRKLRAIKRKAGTKKEQDAVDVRMDAARKRFSVFYANTVD